MTGTERVFIGILLGCLLIFCVVLGHKCWAPMVYNCEELASKCASTQCNEEEKTVRAACVYASKKGD